MAKRKIQYQGECLPEIRGAAAEAGELNPNFSKKGKKRKLLNQSIHCLYTDENCIHAKRVKKILLAEENKQWSEWFATIQEATVHRDYEIDSLKKEIKELKTECDVRQQKIQDLDSLVQILYFQNEENQRQYQKEIRTLKKQLNPPKRSDTPPVPWTPRVLQLQERKLKS